MKCLYPIAEQDVYRFVMPAIRSNMYILTHGGEALVIDPSVDAEAEQMLRDAHISKCIILLTHEHFDHISGVNWLRGLFDCEVVCSKICGGLINSPRKNMAAIFPAMFLGKSPELQREIGARLDTGYSCTADAVYEGETHMDWHRLSIFMKELPGHSRGSQIIRIAGKYIFTGDNLIPGEKTITRLPGGSRTAYEQVALPFFQTLPPDCIIYPGHGDPVTFYDCMKMNTF